MLWRPADFEGFVGGQRNAERSSSTLRNQQFDRDFASSIDFQRFSLTPELHLTPDGALPVCLMLATAADIDSDAHRGLLFAMVWCTRHAAAVVESLCELLPCPSAFCSHKSLLFERDSKVKASILISCLVSSLHKACVSL